VPPDCAFAIPRLQYKPPSAKRLLRAKAGKVEGVKTIGALNGIINVLYYPEKK
jgi:hypothetical protein